MGMGGSRGGIFHIDRCWKFWESQLQASHIFTAPGLWEWTQSLGTFHLKDKVKAKTSPLGSPLKIEQQRQVQVGPINGTLHRVLGTPHPAPRPAGRTSGRGGCREGRAKADGWGRSESEAEKQ